MAIEANYGIPPFARELHRLAVAAGVRAAPVPARADIRINFAGPPGTFPRLALEQVVGNRFPRDAVRGRIAMIGVTAESLHDHSETPFVSGARMPGVEIHANSLDTLLTGRHIRTLPRAIHVAVAALGAFAVTMAVAGGLRGFLTAVLLVPVIAGAAVIALMLDVWLPVVSVIAGVVVGVVAGTAAHR